MITQVKTAEQARDEILAELSTQTGIPQASLGKMAVAWATAAGAEADEFYFQLYRATRAKYIRTSTATALDWTANDFGLTRKAATYAVGFATFTGTPATAIPINTKITDPATSTEDEVVFATLEAATVGGGGTVEVPIQAVLPGEDGNRSASQINTIKDAVSGVTAVTNAAATTLGADEESDEELRARILRKVDGMSLGTKPAILHGAIDFELQEATLYEALGVAELEIPVNEDLTKMPFSGQCPGKLSINNGAEVVTYNGINTNTFPHKFTGVTRAVSGAGPHSIGVSVKEYVPLGRGYRVTSASIVEVHGVLKVYIDDGTSTGPHSELVTLVQKRLQGDGTDRDPGYKGAGTISLTVYSRTALSIDVVLVLAINPLTAYTATCTAVETAVTDYIDALKIGEPLRGFELAEIAKSVDGVEDVSSITINSVTFDGTTFANVTPAATEAIKAGTITAT